MSSTTAALILAYGAITLLGLAVAGLMRQVRHLQAHEAGRPSSVSIENGLVGKEAPPLTANNGHTRQGPYWVLFASPTCSACELVIPGALEAFDGWTGASVVVLSDQPLDLAERFGQSRKPVEAIVDPGARQRFGVRAVPWVVAVDSANQVVLSEPLGSSRKMKTLLRSMEVS